MSSPDDYWSAENRAKREADFIKRCAARQERDEVVDKHLLETRAAFAETLKDENHVYDPVEIRTLVSAVCLLIEKANRPNWGGF